MLDIGDVNVHYNPSLAQRAHTRRLAMAPAFILSTSHLIINLNTIILIITFIIISIIFISIIVSKLRVVIFVRGPRFGPHPVLKCRLSRS